MKCWFTFWGSIWHWVITTDFVYLYPVKKSELFLPGRFVPWWEFMAKQYSLLRFLTSLLKMCHFVKTLLHEAIPLKDHYPKCLIFQSQAHQKGRNHTFKHAELFLVFTSNHCTWIHRKTFFNVCDALLLLWWITLHLQIRLFKPS